MNKIVLCGLCIVASEAFGSTLKERPNIIVIMADDMGWGDVGFNGNSVVRTPNLDTLASDGVVMERFYSVAPLSSPTRASVLTGRHPFRTGVFSANVGMLRNNEVTLPELLKENGYATGLFGKWHLGTLTYKEKDANRGGPENKYLYNPPAKHGFEVAFVTESKVPTYDPMIQPKQNDGRFWDYIREGESWQDYGTAYWNQENSRIEENLNGDDSRVIMDRALPFMKRSIQENKNFFGVIWFHAPHLPCVAGPEHVALYKDLDVEERNYYGCITALDEQIGRLVNFLKAEGIYKDCIILFCSDNGPELKTPGSAGQFRGKKRSLYDGGIRVPSIISWPAGLEGLDKFELPCCTMDYMPTLLDMVGIPLRKNVRLDGESLWPWLTGKNKDKRDPIVFCSDQQAAIVDGDFKLYYSKGRFELYNLLKDPSEQNDISGLYPNKIATLRKCMTERIEDYRVSFEDGKRGESFYWQNWWSVWD